MSRLLAIANPRHQPYPSNLSDVEWDMIQPLLPNPKGFGHPVEVDVHEILKRYDLWLPIAPDASTIRYLGLFYESALKLNRHRSHRRRDG